MIFRHFRDPRSGRHSYLIAPAIGGPAAIVNPLEKTLPDCVQALEALSLRLALTLATDAGPRTRHAAGALGERYAVQHVAPRAEGGAPLSHPPHVEAAPGGRVALGELQIELVAPLGPEAGSIAYRVGDYTFAGDDVLIDYRPGTPPQASGPAPLFGAVRPASAPSAPPPRATPIHNHRSSREGVCIERLILEDLHTSLAEERFTPKEQRVVRAYIECLERGGWSRPSAARLAQQLGDVARTAVHVLVHNIRWKQIDQCRLPLVLAGQTSKWLKGLERQPEFTSHEREFLRAYLRLLAREGRPPSGPDLVRELGGGRSVQWVRKRAHTIRRKQREFELPELELSRKSAGSDEPEPAARQGRPQTAWELRYGT